MYELKTISLKSSARVMSFVLAIFYLFFAAISLVTGQAAVGSGLVSLVIGFILFGVVGAIVGVFVSVCYNFAAKKWGGLHLDFRLIDDPQEKKEEKTHQDSIAQ
jgi:hypothetical protein|tara:strand:- start:157 stop:468 length:312 start_codon:yes stop_codon:yes gene_type:complete